MVATTSARGWPERRRPRGAGRGRGGAAGRALGRPGRARRRRVLGEQAARVRARASGSAASLMPCDCSQPPGRPALRLSRPGRGTRAAARAPRRAARSGGSGCRGSSTYVASVDPGGRGWPCRGRRPARRSSPATNVGRHRDLAQRDPAVLGGAQGEVEVPVDRGGRGTRATRVGGDVRVGHREHEAAVGEHRDGARADRQPGGRPG